MKKTLTVRGSLNINRYSPDECKVFGAENGSGDRC